MKAIIEKMGRDRTGTEKSGMVEPRRWKRLGWFLLIWMLSVATIATIGYGLRAFVTSIYGAGG